MTSYGPRPSPPIAQVKTGGCHLRSKLAANEQESRIEVIHGMSGFPFVAPRGDGTPFTTAEILTDLGVFPERRERVHEMRVGNVLRVLGCERKRGPRASGRPRPWVYRLAEGRTEEDDSQEPDTDHERCDEQK